MRRRLLATAFLLGSALVPVSAASESTIVARVNGVELTQSDLDFAATELGPMLARHSQDDRKRALISYVIENQLMADAAVEENLNHEEKFSDRQKYHDRRALADAYFAKHIKGAVPEEAAKEFYDEQYKPQEQVHARHILLESEEEAERVAERLQAGEDLSKLAKDQSKDKAQGGDLGFISRGQTVKPFEDAAFSLKEREISKPVQTKFGWHIIQIQETGHSPRRRLSKSNNRLWDNYCKQKLGRSSLNYEMIE